MRWWVGSWIVGQLWLHDGERKHSLWGDYTGQYRHIQPVRISATTFIQTPAPQRIRATGTLGCNSVLLSVRVVGFFFAIGALSAVADLTCNLLGITCPSDCWSFLLFSKVQNYSRLASTVFKLLQRPWKHQLIPYDHQTRDAYGRGWTEESYFVSRATCCHTVVNTVMRSLGLESLSMKRLNM